MKWTRVFSIAAVLAFASVAAFAQSEPLCGLARTHEFFAEKLECGSAAELKGLSVYWIDPEAPGSSLFVGYVSGKLPRLRLAETMSSAQIFAQLKQPDGVRGEGAGGIWVPSRSGDKSIPRIILSVQASGGEKFDDWAAIRLADAFVKAYKKANSMK